MAVTAYSSEAALQEFLGADLVSALGGLSGSTASDVITRALEDAYTELDAALGQTYTVPFAAYPSTPRIIHQLANLLGAYYLLLKRHPAAEETKAFRARADDLIEALQKGTYEVPGASKVAADKGARGAKVVAADPVFGGQDSHGVSRMSGW